MPQFRVRLGKIGQFVSCMCVITGLASPLKAESIEQQKHVYSLGVVPQFGQRKIFRIWVPIIERLERETGLKFELVGSHQIPAFENKFMSGKFDFAYMNPYHVVNANTSQGYIPLVRDGSRKLQGIIVVRKDDPIKEVMALSGKAVAYPSAKALGASLLPRSELKEKYNIATKPVYVKTHTSVYLHVAQTLVIAGGGVISTFERQRPEIRKLLRIMYHTRTVNPHPFVAHPRVPAAHIRKVQRAFISMSKTKSGKSLLLKIPMRTVISTTMSDYETVRKLNLHEIK